MTTHRRDEVLLRLLNETGLRIGEALGLRHADIGTADATIEVRHRDNAKRDPRETWDRSVPIGSGWLRRHADYLHYVYSDLDSDYVLIGL